MHKSTSSSSAYLPGLESRAHLSVFLLSSYWVRKFFIDRAPDFLPRFLIKFKEFFYQLNIRFPPQSLTRFRRFFPYKQSRDLKCLHAYRSSYPRKKAIVMS